MEYFPDLEDEGLLDLDFLEAPLDPEQLFDSGPTRPTILSAEIEAAGEIETGDDGQAVVGKRTTKKMGRPKGSFKIPNETLEERKKRVAEVNRRYRERKRDKVQQLKRKNEELEHDQELLKDRIAFLQLEAQMLRGNGTISLEKENELMRAEIQQHKKFLHDVVALTEGTSHLSTTERDRILAAGLASTIGQTLGLVYTSIIDSGWERRFQGALANHELLVAGQYLPRGATHETAVLQNFRIDTWTKAYNATEAAKYIWEKNGFIDFLPEFINEVSQEKFGDIKAELVLENSSLGPNNQAIRVFQLSEDFEDKNKPRSEMLYSFGRQTCSLSTSAFPHQILDANPELKTGDLLEAHIISSSSSQTFSQTISEYVPLREGSERVEHSTLESYLIVDLPRSGCYITMIASAPTKMSGSFGVDFTEPFFTSGNMSPYLGIYLEAVLNALNSIKDPGAVP